MRTLLGAAVSTDQLRPGGDGADGGVGPKMDGGHAANLALGRGHQLHLDGRFLAGPDRSQRPNHLAVRAAAGLRRGAQQTRPLGNQVADFHVGGRNLARVPHGDAEAGRFAHLDFLGGKLLDRQLRALDAFELLAARLDRFPRLPWPSLRGAAAVGRGVRAVPRSVFAAGVGLAGLANGSTLNGAGSWLSAAAAYRGVIAAGGSIGLACVAAVGRPAGIAGDQRRTRRRLFGRRRAWPPADSGTLPRRRVGGAARPTTEASGMEFAGSAAAGVTVEAALRRF